MQLERTEHSVSYAYGFLYGFLIALVAYNFMLFVGLRERRYLLYSAYTVALIVLNVAYTGHGLSFLWPHQPGLQRYVILGLMVAVACVGLLFSRRFLALQTHAPKLDAWIRWSSLVLIPAFLATVVVQSQWAAVWLAFTADGVFMVAMVCLGLMTARSGRWAGRYFLLAMVCGMTGLAGTFLVVLGLIPFDTLSYHGLELGITLEATLLALAVAHQMRQHQIVAVRAEHLARHDPLTGLLNRRAFQERAQAMWSTAERGRRALSLMLVDLDHFKEINDAYGHAVGDMALVKCGELLTKACRAGDMLVRWGGEEFIFLLPETDLEQACAFAERVRLQLAEMVWHADQPALRLSASFGVAQRGHQGTLDELVHSADQALYHAKHLGRNQVVRAQG
jgi:diguanylate cyclase (GGDEF)-like protein